MRRTYKFLRIIPYKHAIEITFDPFQADIVGKVIYKPFNWQVLEETNLMVCSDSYSLLLELNVLQTGHFSMDRKIICKDALTLV